MSEVGTARQPCALSTAIERIGQATSLTLLALTPAHAGAPLRERLLSLNLATIRLVGQWQRGAGVVSAPAYVVRDMSFRALARLTTSLSVAAVHWEPEGPTPPVLLPAKGPHRYLTGWSIHEIEAALSGEAKLAFVGFKYVSQTFAEALVRYHDNRLGA